MKKILISGFILCIALQVFAGNTRTYSVIKIWQGIDTICYKNEHSQLLVFTPDSSKNNNAAVIICPGGSYGHLGVKHEGIEVAQWLTKLGFTAFVLKYRVGMQGYHHPAMIQDLQRSIQIVRERAISWGIQHNKVGVMGFSAGGHLVGVAGIHYDYNFLAYQGLHPTVSLRPDFVVMVYPVVSMRDSIAHKKSKRNLLGRNYSEDLIHKMSLEENVHAHVPPIFIVHAVGDKVVDYRNSVYLYRELQRASIPHIQYIQFECEGHGFGISEKRNAVAWKWIFDCEQWMKSIGLEIRTNVLSSLPIQQLDNK